MEHLASKRKLWYTISLIVIIPGTISLILCGLNRGIDFTGGTLWELQFEEAVESRRSPRSSTPTVTDTVVRSSDDGPKNNAAHPDGGAQGGVAEKATLEEALPKAIGPFTELRIRDGRRRRRQQRSAT